MWTIKLMSLNSQSCGNFHIYHLSWSLLVHTCCGLQGQFDVPVRISSVKGAVMQYWSVLTGTLLGICLLFELKSKMAWIFVRKGTPRNTSVEGSSMVIPTLLKGVASYVAVRTKSRLCGTLGRVALSFTVIPVFGWAAVLFDVTSHVTVGTGTLPF